MTEDARFAALDEHSVRFLRSVQAHFGKTTGAQVVKELQNILGNDWGGRIIFNLLADNHKGAPEIFYIDAKNCDRKINAIKELRSICPYMGLKEAKDAIEAAAFSTQKIRVGEMHPSDTPEMHEARLRRSFVELRSWGCIISE